MGCGEVSKITLRSLLSLHNVVRVIKSRRLRWVGHVARMEEGRNALKILTGRPEVKIPLENLGVDWKTILKWILNN